MKSTLRDGARATLAMLLVGARTTWSARAVLLGRVLFFAFVMIAVGGFWQTVAKEHVVGALAVPHGIITYVAIAEWITLSVPAIHLRLEDDIRSGALEAHLLRPVPYLVCQTSEMVGTLIVRLLVMAPVAIVAIVSFGAPLPSAAMWPLIAALCVLGGTVNVLINSLAGLSTFWTRRSVAAFLILQKLSFLLGGLFIPVTFYPGWLARLAMFSPFAAGLYWPAMLTLDATPGTTLVAFAAVIAWIALMALLCAGIWYAGLRRLLSDGI